MSTGKYSKSAKDTKKFNRHMGTVQQPLLWPDLQNQEHEDEVVITHHLVYLSRMLVIVP